MITKIALMIFVSLSTKAMAQTCEDNFDSRNQRALILVAQEPELPNLSRWKILHDYGQVKVLKPGSFSISDKGRFEVYLIAKTGDDEFHMIEVQNFSAIVVKTRAELIEFFQNTYPNLDHSNRLGLMASVLVLNMSEKKRPFDGESWDLNPPDIL